MAKIVNGTAFDSNMNVSGGFAMNPSGIKEIAMRNGQPYGTRIEDGKEIRFLGLHFQSASKRYLYRYYTGPGLRIQRMKDRLKLFKRALKHLVSRR